MPGLFYLIIIFIFGTIVGSFLNCVIYRLEQGQSFLKGRSYCPLCKHILSWQDLIPVLSFLFLKGKCRYCQKSISWQYPSVELSTATIFLFLYSFSLLNFDAMAQIFRSFYLMVISCFLIIIFVYDLKHYIIPDKIIYSAIIISCILYLVSSIFLNIYTKYEILNTIYSAFGVALFFLAIVLVSRGKWMGVGDIKLAFFMGLFLGWPNILVALFSAFFIGAIIGIGLIPAGKKHLKSEVPFGPFLVTGTLLAMLWGGEIVNWYLTFFLPR